MAIYNAYFDESGKHHDHPVVTLSCVCVAQSKLEQFNSEWERLLDQYGWNALHMVDAMRNRKLSPKVSAVTTEERIEAMKPFVDCINTKLDFGIVQALDVKGFNGLSKTLRAGLGNPNDPYFVAFMRALIELTERVQAADRISLLCDYDIETAWDCYRHWKGIRQAHNLISKKTISLTFADDEYFPALQAADMVAYLARLEAKRQFYGTPHSYRKLLDYLIDKRSPNSTIKWGVMFAGEQLLRSMSTRADKIAALDQAASLK
jgi:hypothetical protein